jgi:hypothetical protein
MMEAVLRIQIRGIHMFLDFLDPDPVVRCVEPEPGPDTDPSVTKKNTVVRRTLILTALILLFVYLSLKNYVNVPSKSYELNK